MLVLADGLHRTGSRSGRPARQQKRPEKGDEYVDAEDKPASESDSDSDYNEDDDKTEQPRTKAATKKRGESIL